MTITITAFMVKMIGIPLFILSCIVLVFGSMPGSSGSSTANAFRWVVWPLFLLWFVWIFVRGLSG